MKRFRAVFYLFFRQMVAAFSNKRVLAGYLIGITVSLVASNNYSKFIGEHTTNIAEAFLQDYTGTDLILMVFGFIIALSDAPFVRTDSFMMMHRTGRKQWYQAMWLYIVVQGVLYYGCSLIASTVFIIRKAYIQNVWSIPYAEYPRLKVMRFQIAVPDERIINNYTPYSAMLHTFLLILLYSMILIGIMFVLNMYRHTAVGTIMAALVHVSGVIIYGSFQVVVPLMPYSFMLNASFVYHFDFEISFIHSYILFVLCMYIIYVVGSFVVLKTDFNSAESSESDA